MDAPLWVHWPKLGLWVAFEAVLLAMTGYLDHMNLPIKTSEPAGTELECKDWQYNCSFDGEPSCCSCQHACSIRPRLSVW